MTDGMGLSDLRQNLASIASSDGLGNLMLRQLGLSPKFYAPCHNPGPTFTSPRQDQRPFEFSEPSQDRQHQPAVRGSRIGPRIGKRPEACSLLGNGSQHVEKVPSASGQPIQPRITVAISEGF